MVADMAINDNDGWLESGHEWVGQQVLRMFPSVGPSTGKITKYLPADEEAGDGALFHVVHDADGDQEDLEEEEAHLAIEAHREQAEAGGTVSTELEQPKYHNMFEQKRLRVAVHQLGVAGLRGELLDLEEGCACAPHVHCMCTACAPHAHRMCTARAPHMHCACHGAHYPRAAGSRTGCAARTAAGTGPTVDGRCG
tara:strand:+ start:119 stop:706 length:588 start_codon:yes stop_codon:yes gene_type:complete